MEMFLAFIFSGLAVYTKSEQINFDNDQMQFFKKQLDILKLVDGLSSPIANSDLLDILASFNPLENLNSYDNPDTVRHYYKSVKNGDYLQRGEPFDILNFSSLLQMIELFEVFHFASNWDTFFNSAVVAREVANEEQFFYALSVYLLNQPENFLLPPLYELFPLRYLSSSLFTKQQTPENKTKTIKKCRQENRISYLLDDLDLNEQRALWHMMWPFWWNSEKYGVSKPWKGEEFLFMNHQFVNRINAERYANGQSEMLALNWSSLVLSGQTRRNNRQILSENLGLQNLSSLCITDLEAIENRIREAISDGFVISVDNETRVNLNETHGFDLLGSIIESSTNSINPDLYGNLYYGAQSVLQNLNGEMKLAELGLGTDIFQSYANTDNLALQLRNRLPTPMDNAYIEMSKLDKVEVRAFELLSGSNETSLSTHFETINYTILSLLEPGQKNIENVFQITRLMNRPFEIIITVNSKIQQDVTGRLFMAPKYDINGNVVSLSKQTWNFLLLDKFSARLVPGENTLTRKSTDFSETSADMLSSTVIRSLVEDALAGNDQLDLEKYTRKVGKLPNRLLLPRGTTNGVPYTFFAMLNTPDEDAGINRNDQSGLLRRTLGFPFDRKISCKNHLKANNMRFLDVIVKHVKTRMS